MITPAPSKATFRRKNAKERMDMHNNCRFCNAPLEHVFADLGHQPPSNSFLTKEQLEGPETYYPLKVYVCDKCFLVQLPEVKKAAEIFAGDYPYYSSQSPANVAHAKELAEMLINRFGLDAYNIVLEIGSNDGYLLQWFKEKELHVIGMDPAKGPAEVARKAGISTICDLFGSWAAKAYNFDTAHADLICGINVLAHQPDINDFVEGLRIALAPDGVIVMEFPHLMRLVDGLQFDTIYAEHYSYFSLTTLRYIFSEHRLDIFDVEEIPEHGGSLRIYAQHERGPQQTTFRVDNLLLAEAEWGVADLGRYSGFRAHIEKVRSVFMRFMYSRYDTIAAYGAAAKASTFLNYCGIRSDLVQFVVDRSPHKQGLFLPGSHIPVFSEDVLKERQPAYVLITAWNLKEEIMAQLSYARDWGAKFVVAIPKLEVL
jgi:SAM-dependent methyltransferase